jgi:hypothetical protein
VITCSVLRNGGLDPVATLLSVGVAPYKIGALRFRPIAPQLLVFGILYPCVAGLDSERQSLYFNIAALLFIALAARQLIKAVITTNRTAQMTS